MSTHSRSAIRVTATVAGLVLTIGLAGYFLIPAAQKAYVPSPRNEASNHLKVIGLAMYNYADRHKTLPPPAIYGKDGKPLLSWRVLLLPYIEQRDLHTQFHLDEPWD